MLAVALKDAAMSKKDFLDIVKQVKPIMRTWLTFTRRIKESSKTTLKRQNTQLMDKTKSYKGISQVKHKIVRQIIQIVRHIKAITRKKFIKENKKTRSRPRK